MKFNFIFILIFLLGLSQVIALNAYEVELEYDSGNLSLKQLKVIPVMEAPVSEETGLYVAEILSSENKILNLTFFAIPTEVFYDLIDENGDIVGGGVNVLIHTEKRVLLPHFPEASRINFYNQNLTLLLSVDLGRFSEVGFEEEAGIVDELIKDEEVTGPKDSQHLLWFSLTIVLVINIMIIAVILMRKKNAA